MTIGHLYFLLGEVSIQVAIEAPRLKLIWGLFHLFNTVLEMKNKSIRTLI